MLGDGPRDCFASLFGHLRADLEEELCVLGVQRLQVGAHVFMRVGHWCSPQSLNEQSVATGKALFSS